MLSVWSTTPPPQWVSRKLLISRSLGSSCSLAKLQAVDNIRTWISNVKKKKSTESRKRAHLEEDLDAALSKKKRLEETYTKLLKDADHHAKKAESKHDFTLLTSSNTLRMRATEIRNKKSVQSQETLKSYVIN